MAERLPGKRRGMPPLPRWVRPALGFPLVLALVSGCSATDTDDARRAATAFTEALAAGDGRRACELLSPPARDEVELTTGDRCEQGLLSEGLPATVGPTAAEVWGDQAQVRTAEDTLFLSRYDSGWRVIAAGCKPRADRPYDCLVQGS
jgi:hypothetical protein